MSHSTTLFLAYRPPFDWQSLMRFYHNHRIEPVEFLEGGTYGRFFEIHTAQGFFSLKNDATRHRLELTVHTSDPTCLPVLEAQVRRMFDLDAEPAAIETILAQQTPLDDLCAAHPGMRIAGSWSLFEAGMFAILGQLVSTAQARALARQLLETCGAPVQIAGITHLGHLFPAPAAVLASDLMAVRTTQARKKTLWAFAEFAADGRLDQLPILSPTEARKQLLALPGIGPWTADVVAIRGLGNTDVFPASDLILKRALALFPHLDLAQMSPWRSYATFLVWRGYAEALSKVKKHGKANL